jgi:beta-lactamase class A
VTNDLAIIWPPHRQPVLVAAYLRDSSAPADARNGALAEVGRLVAGWIEAS